MSLGKDINENEVKICNNCNDIEGSIYCKYCEKMICYQCVVDKSTIIIKSKQNDKSCYECWEEYVADYIENNENMDEKKIETRLSYLDESLNLPDKTLLGLHDGWLIRCQVCHNIWNGIEKCPCNINNTLNNYDFNDNEKELSIKNSLDPRQQNNFRNNIDMHYELMNGEMEGMEGIEELADMNNYIEYDEFDYDDEENLENEDDDEKFFVPPIEESPIEESPLEESPIEESPLEESPIEELTNQNDSNIDE